MTMMVADNAYLPSLRPQIAEILRNTPSPVSSHGRQRWYGAGLLDYVEAQEHVSNAQELEQLVADLENDLAKARAEIKKLRKDVRTAAALH